LCRASKHAQEQTEAAMPLAAGHTDLDPVLPAGRGGPNRPRVHVHRVTIHTWRTGCAEGFRGVAVLAAVPLPLCGSGGRVLRKAGPGPLGEHGKCYN
jgi:hypothetical protein